MTEETSFGTSILNGFLRLLVFALILIILAVGVALILAAIGIF